MSRHLADCESCQSHVTGAGSSDPDYGYATTQLGPSDVASGASLRPGDVIVGKYQFERYLGEGGMGVVAAAIHLALEQRVALKFLHPHSLMNPRAVERFRREARAAARLKSEHVGRVLDLERLESGEPFIVMEYLEGQDLREVLRQRGAMPVAEAVDLVRQACEAVHEAHRAGLVHRDLKPANLFISHRRQQATIKVLDFGASKFIDDAHPALTRTGGLLGSPRYMAPEQFNAPNDVGPGADIWALGLILYEMLLGSFPFPDTPVIGLMPGQAKTEPRRFAPSGVHVPPELESAILRCLEKEPADRFASAEELSDALAPFGSSRAQALSSAPAGDRTPPPGWPPVLTQTDEPTMRVHSPAPFPAPAPPALHDSPGSSPMRPVPLQGDTMQGPPGKGPIGPTTPGSDVFAPVDPGSGAIPPVEPGSGAIPPVEPGSGAMPPVNPGSGAMPLHGPNDFHAPRGGDTAPVRRSRFGLRLGLVGGALAIIACLGLVVLARGGGDTRAAEEPSNTPAASESEQGGDAPDEDLETAQAAAAPGEEEPAEAEREFDEEGEPSAASDTEAEREERVEEPEQAAPERPAQKAGADPAAKFPAADRPSKVERARAKKRRERLRRQKARAERAKRERTERKEEKDRDILQEPESVQRPERVDEPPPIDRDAIIAPDL